MSTPHSVGDVESGPAPFTTTGTINGACSSYFTSAAGVPAACFGVALMPMVQALSCVLTRSEADGSSVQHQKWVKRSWHAFASSAQMANEDLSLPTLVIPGTPVLPANLGGVMNGNARLSRAGRQSSQSSARRCARRLPLLLIFYPCGLNRIPIEGVQWMISHCEL